MNKILCGLLIIGAIASRGESAREFADIDLYSFYGVSKAPERIAEKVIGLQSERSLQDSFTNAIYAANLHYQLERRYSCLFLVDAEMAAATGDRGRVCEAMKAYSRLFEYQDEFLPLIGDAALIESRYQAEYAIARMINDRREGSVRITSEDVVRWLPDVQRDSLAANKHIIRQNDFRTLLVLGALIETRRVRDGVLPDSLDEILDEAPLSAGRKKMVRLTEGDVYTHKGDYWKLRLHGTGGEPEGEFIPVIDQIAGTVYPEIWFASTYSSKRISLIEEGCLANESPKCKCYFDNGIIRRGDRVKMR